jgi:hypothetical protein
MKATQVYSALRGHLTPTFKAAGFQTAKSMLSWVRPQRNRHVLVWCQVSRDGWDSYAGSKFVVEFQLSEEPVVGAAHVRRRRLGGMLDDKGREEMRLIQNEVISSLRRPPASHPLLHAVTQLRHHYLSKFQKIDQPYTEHDDIWCRYSRGEHIDAWAKFVADKLPECLQQIESWENFKPK